VILPAAPIAPTPRNFILALELSQNTLFLRGVETYPSHSRRQVRGLTGILEPTLLSDDTELARAAPLSLFWRHSCWDYKVLFWIAGAHWDVTGL